uniref:Uncharacterized protein n=1 Tax=Salmonella phage vB_SE130_2P TaxID=3236707 RepID=A0AB39C4C8_9VIRU
MRSDNMDAIAMAQVDALRANAIKFFTIARNLQSDKVFTIATTTGHRSI